VIKPQAPAGYSNQICEDWCIHDEYIAPSRGYFCGRMRNSASRISLLQDKEETEQPDNCFLENLNQPFGMLILNNFSM
jgi:hypothetical protein